MLWSYFGRRQKEKEEGRKWSNRLSKEEIFLFYQLLPTKGRKAFLYMREEKISLTRPLKASHCASDKHVEQVRYLCFDSGEKAAGTHIFPARR